jgi:hypothetical protein
VAHFCFDTARPWRNTRDEEVDMVRSFTTALVAALLLGSVGFASAQTFQRYDGVSYPHQNETYCYVPSSPCDNEHRVTN